MRVFINELSFQGQAETLEEAAKILKRLFEVGARAKKISRNNLIERHSNLLGQKISQQNVLAELFSDIKNINDPGLRQVIRLFLQTFGRGPYFDSTLNENFPGHTCKFDEDSTDLSGTCVAAAALSPSGGVIISAEGSAGYTKSRIPIHFQIEATQKEKKVEIKNYLNIEDAVNDTWEYEANPKHNKRDTTSKGNPVSHMALSDREAQHVLTQGIKIGRMVYGKKNKQWYKFPCHHENSYHAFPVNEEEVPNKVKKKWQVVGADNEGQIEL